MRSEHWRKKDQRYVSIKKMRKDEEGDLERIISKTCAMCIHYSEWTFECAVFKALARSGSFLISSTPCSRQLVSLAVRRSCALSLASLLLLPLPVSLPQRLKIEKQHQAGYCSDSLGYWLLSSPL